MRLTTRSVLLGALALSACHFGDPMEVLNASPQGELEAVPRWLEVQFDKPVVDPDQADDLPEKLELVIEPPIPGDLRFTTPATLTYTFGGAVPPAQKYRVTISSGLRSADGDAVLKDDYTFEFTSERNKVARLSRLAPFSEGESFPTSGESRLNNMALNERLLVTFRHPETIATLKELVKVMGKPMAGGEARPLEHGLSFQDGEHADLMVISPKESWPKHTHIWVKVPPGLGVTGVDAGPIKTTYEQTVVASTYGPIEVVKGPECDMCKPPATLRVEFSTPVECSAALSFIKLKPRPDDIRCAGQPSPTVVRVEPVPALGAYTEYTLRVKPGVTDAFGQRLDEAARYEFKTGDANPRFAHQLMFNVLERKQGTQHEEKVFGTERLKVEAAKLPFAEAWKIIAGQGLGDQVAWAKLPWWLSGDYYGYYYEDSCHWDDELGEEVCDGGSSSRRHPGAADTADITVPGAKTEWVDVDAPRRWKTVPVPLDPYLGGKGGVVVVKATPYAKGDTRLSNPVLRLLNVTDIGLSAKYSPNRLILLAANLSDGKPVPNAEVKVYSVSKGKADLGEALATGTTDETGVALFSASELTRPGEEPNLQKQGLFISAATADDEAFIWSSFESGGRRASGSGPQLVGKVYTERGVYRPGETVYYRVVARTQTAGGFATPSGSTDVEAIFGRYSYDGDDKIHTESKTFSDYGTVSGSFVVPEAARIGDYRLVAEVGDKNISGYFKVAEFRRAEMKVSVNTDKSEYITGEKMQVTINADYLFGAPAAGLDMRYSLRRNWGYYNSRRFPGARFTDYSYHSWYDDRDSYSEFVDERTVKLDDNGSFTFSKRLSDAGSRGRIEGLVVSGTVEDESGQSVSARRTVRVHPASFHVGIIPRGYLREVNKMFTYDLVVVDPKDKPVEGIKVKVSAHQDYWYSTKRKGPGGRHYWTWKREEIHLKDVCTGASNDQGKITCQFKPEKGGDIRLRAEAKDERGRKVRASTWFWVVGDPNYYGGRDDRNQVSLMSEAPELEAGKDAKIAITSPFQEGLALVTVEREDILWQKTMPIGSNGTVNLHIEPTWAPNVYVSATVVRGRVTPEGDLKPDPERDKPAYALGYLNLKVKPTNNILKVDVNADKDAYEPGQKARAHVKVTDHSGAPVKSEVNLFAVDEGVLILTNYKTPNLIPSMFRERAYAVLALDTRPHVLGERKYVTPVIKGQEDGGGGGEEEDDELRKDFNPVAVWVGALETGSNGEASKTFELPDTLTTYRLMAVAVTEKDRFGSGDSEFKVKKTLMMRQAMPRFVRPGDRISAGVVVNQLSGKDYQVTVSLTNIDEKLFKVSGKRELQKTVGAKETVAFRFDLEANDLDGASEIIFSAKMSSFKDKVQLILPVKRLQAREARAISGVLEPGDFTHTLTLPDVARPVDLEFNMSALPVASLEERVRHLVGYPYGCLEQRTSKIMPLIAIKELSEKLKFTSIKTDKIEGWVKDWVGRVPKYFCGDDGFDYYPGCRSGSDPYLTAFALDGLLTAKKHGYKVPESLIDRPARYLENQLAKMDGNKSSWDRNSSGLAGALRILAQLDRSKPAFENTLYEGRSGLPLFAKTDLARALVKRGKDERVETLVKEITAGGVRKGGVMTFKAVDAKKYWWAWDSDMRSTALVLRTLLEVEPNDSRVPLIIKGLVDLDGRQSYYATQGLTQTLLALADAVERLKATGQAPVATISVNGKKHVSQAKVGQKVETKKLEGGAIGKSPYEIEIENSGNGPLYFGGFLHYAYPATARLPAHAQGFKVEREYTDRKGKPIGKEVRVGDYVQVSLKIWVDEEGRMVVVDDPLPAGLEPVDTTLATSDTEVAKVMPGGSDWSWWRSRYKEMRDDRTEWHFRQLWRTYNNSYPIKLSYLTKATTPGTYYAPGTTVERMYQPHVRGRGEGRGLVVKPKK